MRNTEDEMINTDITPAVQSLIETGWPVPEGVDMAVAADLAAGRPRWWHRFWLPRPEAPVDALRRWVWAAITESYACRRAQAARAACTLRGLGVACGACRGTGVDPTGTPTVRAELWTRPTMQPRCRLCGGIGLLAEPLNGPFAPDTAVDEHQALLDGLAADQADDDQAMVDRLNPYERTGKSGLGGMRGYGENRAADAVVTAIDADRRRRLLMVERADGLGWALPGGHIETGETAADAAVRELVEETRLRLPSWLNPQPLDERYVPDARATDEAWIVTTPVRLDLGIIDALPEVGAGDGTRRAAWVHADTYGQLVTDLDHEYGGRACAAHAQMLVDLLP